MDIKRSISWKKRIGVATASLILILGAIWWMALPLPINYETEIPVYAKSYSVVPISCDCSAASGCQITLEFHSREAAQKTMPEYTVEENTNQAETVITFNRVSEIDGKFDYQQITQSPLIESIDNKILDGGRFSIAISRKGAYIPAKISTQNLTATIILPAATKDYPVISNQKPAADSAAFPALHPISFEAVLKSPLKSATAIFQNQPVELTTANLAPNEYRLSFEKNLEIDKEYSVKAIIADDQGRTMVSSWSFTGQIPSAAILGKDRFKYLGWWGQINADGVAVRKDMASVSDKLGTLSSANRVKVLREVYGEWVDGKNLWYQIDGGMHPGGYILSDYVTPMMQPEPPKNFTVPESVGSKDKWIDVDLTKKVFTLFDYDTPIFATYISPGRPENPTQTGTYRIWYKLVKTEMKGGPPLHAYKYDLKNIPWTMFYNYDYAIHGTYWHDKFGMQQSAGCTNMTQGDAKYIFDNTLPAIPDGAQSILARDESGKGTGTVVHNHE